ncbi:hypothetical protein QVD17_16474 [Tagetes erecta]|uniref:MULE transposase domain-containing protein n=1 Tax=Tagetes erecta TaxID=13708 RepID=A0AAD8KSA2_TARER|nr:hypothetical protein QVD17_16474 [Tagetes erecta]
MADTIVDDRAVFIGFDSLTYAPREIEITLPNSSEKYYIHDVLKELKPKVQVGMTFDNMDKAFAYYCKEINFFINEYDAEMMVGNLMKKKEHLPDFSCEYFTDDENCLLGLFWYSMVFVPFTGIDNHNNNVSFGGELLASETAETYKWLLRCFLKAFGKQPDVIVTDQDPAMKKSIEEVFTSSQHRLCMWHVMHKLSTKVGLTLCNTYDFKQRIGDIVWTDSLSPAEFEEGWHSVIQDFDLSNNNWLADIYDMRESWIPAYYRDELMSGLMRYVST